MKRKTIGLLAAVTLLGTSLVAASAQVKIGSLAEPVMTVRGASDHRVIVYDSNSLHLNATAAYVIDGDSGKVEGMFGTGEQANLGVSPDRTRIYAADTYWSRLNRGTRTDVVTTYDASTLAVLHEVVIPPKRLIMSATVGNAAVSPDGRYVLVFNEAPATSVTVVDTGAQKFLGEVDARGCWGTFPSANDRFLMLCGNGGFLTVTFGVRADGTLASAGQESKPFFDVGRDPVFATPAADPQDGRVFFLSYGGVVHEVDVSKAVPAFSPTWSVLGPADRVDHWRPGGWQVQAFDRASRTLYVLMHRGGEWTHKFPGTEVWAYDVRTHRNTRRIKLRSEAISIALSSDGAQLYALDEEKATLDVYAAPTGRLLHSVDELGYSPTIVYSSGH